MFPSDASQGVLQAPCCCLGLLGPSEHSQEMWDLSLGLVTGWITFTLKALSLFVVSGSGARCGGTTAHTDSLPPGNL